MTQPSRLQLELAEQIVDFLRGEGASPGSRLSENGLARRLGVSRTPVRAALSHLTGRGVLRRGEDGIVVAAIPAAQGDAEPDEVDAAMVLIARNREAGTVPDTISEQEAMRRFGLSRAMLGKVFARLAELDLIERKPGYGWRFMQEPRDPVARAESYRFRMLVEPAALLEPGFALERGWIETMRARHRAALERPWRESSAVAFFEMNADFHEGLAAASGNRFILGAIRRQNALRRLSNYDWVFGTGRVAVNCREHLDMLDHLDRGETEVAAALMRSHLAKASALRSETGNR